MNFILNVSQEKLLLTFIEVKFDLQKNIIVIPLTPIRAVEDYLSALYIKHSKMHVTQCAQARKTVPTIPEIIGIEDRVFYRAL